MVRKTFGASYPSKGMVETQLPDEADFHNEQLYMKSNAKKKRGLFEFETDILWPNTIGLILLHTLAVYSILTFDFLQNWKTNVWMYITFVLAEVGVTAGVHRYWTHRCYKATMPFKIFIAVLYSLAGQAPIYYWVRDHRVHHKYTDTAADPHDSTRGFFFSHVGWLMLKKKPEVVEKGRLIDMSDVARDPVVQFVDRHFNIIKLLGTMVVPSLIPMIGWNETPLRSFISQAIIRYTLVLNCTWAVNSAAHAWGYRPYNKHILPSENVLVSVLAAGEGWHNYHHAFPWDYKAAEFVGPAGNITGVFLGFCEKLGLVYELKQASPEMIKRMANRIGDGSYNNVKEAKHPNALVTPENF